MHVAVLFAIIAYIASATVALSSSIITANHKPQPSSTYCPSTAISHELPGLDISLRNSNLGEPRLPSEFELNQGRAIDSLRCDYPSLLTEEPDMSIFREDIKLHDLSGNRVLAGTDQYRNFFRMLRFLRASSMSDDEITYSMCVYDQVIRVRWSAKVVLQDPLLGIQQLNILDGVSLYELDSTGFIYIHKLENIVLRGKEHLLWTHCPKCGH